MKKNLALFIVFMLITSIFVLPANVAAESNIEVVFSENFEGDLSRWTCDAYRKAVAIEKDEDDTYINQYLQLSFDRNASSSLEIPETKSEKIDVLPNTIYTLAADVKGEKMQKIYVHFLDKNGAAVSTDELLISTLEPGEWECFSRSIKTPEDASMIQIGLTKRDDAFYYDASYDNIILCKGRINFKNDIVARKKSSPHAIDNSETVVASDVVFYDNFENSNEKWAYEKEDGKWIYINDKSKSRSEPSTDDSYNGKASLLVADELNKYSVGVDSTKFEAVAGAEYTLSFHVHHKSQDVVDVSLKFFDKDDKLITKKTASINKYDTKWRAYEVKETVPKNAKTAQVSIVSSGDVGENYIDNLKVVSSIIPEKKDENADITGDKYDEIRKNSMILFIGSPNALVKGEKKFIDETNDKVVANIIDSRTLVPARFIASNYGADVLWDAPTKTVTLKLTDKTVTIVLDKNEIKINDNAITIDVPAQSIEGRTMLPLRAFVEQVMAKSVFWDARGLIVITDEAVLDAQKDADIINKLVDDIKNG